MKTSSTKITGSILVGAAVSLTGACGSSGPGGGDADAFLTIVGDRSVYLESGVQADLEVRYHDRDDQPLQGNVEFAIEGEAAGAQLTGSSATTDGEGVAAMTLDATNEEQVTFNVTASAAGAGSVSWEITLEEPAKPVNPNGTYRVDSNIDMVTNLDGDAGQVVNGILQLTTDPGTYVLLEVARRCCISEDQARTFGPALTQLLEDNAPELVGDILALGELLDDNLKSFGFVSELSIEGETVARTGDHTVTGALFRHDGETTEVTVSGLEREPTTVEGIDIAADEENATVGVGVHTAPVLYGAILAAGIDDVLIPAIDPEAEDFAAFLSARIDCGELASAVATEFELGLAVELTLQGACELGVPYLANEAMDRIRNLDDTGLSLVVEGSADAQDDDEDGSADGLANGRWYGSIEYGESAAATLEGVGNVFAGERLD